MSSAAILVVVWGAILAFILFTPKGTVNMVWIGMIILIALSPLIPYFFPFWR